MKYTTILHYAAKLRILPLIFIFLVFISGGFSNQNLYAQQGVVPTMIPDGSFAVDGNLLARTPDSPPFSPDDGDFLPNDNAAGNGGYVFDLSGMPLDTLTSFHVIDGYDNADANIFTNGSKFNMDPNNWAWRDGKPPAKDDLNHILFFFSGDSLGNIWFIGAGDRKRAKGNTYLDFELLQNSLYQNPDSTFTSMGPHGGRTLGDLAITIEFVNGGINPELFVYTWDSVDQGVYDYVMLSPPAGTAYFAVNADSNVVVPYGAFGESSYEKNTFTEVALNINELMPGNYSCLNIKTVIAKTKASHAINAALKDVITPVQVNISSAPVVSVDDVSICYGDTAMLTASITSGTGPFTYLWSTGDTTQSIYVSPDTTTQYSVVVTGVNGCPSGTEYATVTVFLLPLCDISGPESICPLGTGQFMAPDSLGTYLWTVDGPATIVGDSTLQIVEVQGTGYCDTTFTLELYVTDPNGCSSTCSTTVGIIDTLAPVFSNVPDSLFLQCASTVPAASPDAVSITDNCAGDIDVVVSDSIMNDTLCPNQFTLIRTWTATDTCGNMSMASQYISVFDSIPPVLFGVPADTGVCCADSIPPPANVTAIDSCDGAIDVSLSEIVSDSTSPFYFTLTRIWTAWDTCNNIASDTMVIEVNDTLYPLYGGMVGINPGEDIVIYFKATPNPFSHETNVEFSLTQDAYVTLELYNFTGLQLKTLFNGSATAGSRVSVKLATEAFMPSGMYLLVLKTSYGISSRRILLNR
ncbi:MAG: T9SS type A sorting domain-containing protein [Bacteroidales bacterium]|nr:T9SS type A sorting domain-containing protein [Bacteroidales bacterium]